MAGQLGAGKSSIAKALANSLAWHYGSFGDYVREVANGRGLEHNRDNLQAVGETLIRDLSANEFIGHVIKRSGWDGTNGGIVIEGIRHDHIAETLRSFLHPVPYALVYLDAPREHRELRLKARGRTEAADLNVAERHSTEREVATLIRAQADLTIRATGDVDAAVSEIVNLLSHDRRGV